MFLLDTDTIIYNLKGNEGIERNLQDHFEDPMKICVITLMELYFSVKLRIQKVAPTSGFHLHCSNIPALTPDP